MTTQRTHEQIRQELSRPFSLMLEAVEYRLDILEAEAVRFYDLIPAAEFERIRIYVSDVDKIRRLVQGQAGPMGYVSFVGRHRVGVMEAVEALDVALIRKSPSACPILGYFSLQDSEQAWVNLVLFEDLEAVGKWVSDTQHADDWKAAAEFFHTIDKSVGRLRLGDGGMMLEPRQVLSRDYDAA